MATRQLAWLQDSSVTESSNIATVPHHCGSDYSGIMYASLVLNMVFVLFGVRFRHTVWFCLESLYLQYRTYYRRLVYGTTFNANELAIVVEGVPAYANQPAASIESDNVRETISSSERPQSDYDVGRLPESDSNSLSSYNSAE